MRCDFSHWPQCYFSRLTSLQLKVPFEPMCTGNRFKLIGKNEFTLNNKQMVLIFQKLLKHSQVNFFITVIAITAHTQSVREGNVFSLSVHKVGVCPVDIGVAYQTRQEHPHQTWDCTGAHPHPHWTWDRTWVSPHWYDIWWTDLELVGIPQ